MPDAVGNLFRTKERKDRKYAPGGQLLRSGTTRYHYDAEGNLMRKKEADGREWWYEWNASGMLSRVVRPDGQTMTFTYDALGRRLSKTFRGETTHWIWDGNTPLHEWSENATIHAPAGQAAQQAALNGGRLAADLITWLFEPESFAPLAKLTKTASYDIVSDHLGTPVTMHNASGETVWSAVLNSYGQVLNSQGKAEDCPFRFPGQYEDVETGLYYNRFRYYDAKEGIYISKDPSCLWGGNKPYSYVHDSNSYCDVLGLSKLPYGFKSYGQFKQFGEVAQAGLTKAGYPNTIPFLQGSAVTGIKFTTGAPFDVGRKSDFDLALTGEVQLSP